MKKAFLILIIFLLVGCSAGQSASNANSSITEITEVPSSTPIPSTNTPTIVPPTQTFTPTSEPTVTLTPTFTKTPTPTEPSKLVIPKGWNLYEQRDGLYAIGYPSDWEESPFPFSMGADLTLFPSNEPIFVKVEIAVINDPSGITVEEVAAEVQIGLDEDPNIEIFPLEHVDISGQEGLVRDVELNVTDGGGLSGRHYYFVENGYSYIITILADVSVIDKYQSDFDEIMSTFSIVTSAP